MSSRTFLSLLAVVVVAFVAVILWQARPKTTPNPTENPQQEAIPLSEQEKRTPPTAEDLEAVKEAGSIPVTIATDKGEIKVELRGDLMPLTVANFTKLAKDGFYDGLTFHRVEDWVVQGGDPQGTGRGGPGYAIKLETHPELKNVRGAVAMARSSNPDSAGSQFYFLKKDASWLDGDYAVFGNVTSGMDVVDNLQVGDKMTKVTVGQ